jgi:predicted LPLAT superfamily acyltransferase
VPVVAYFTLFARGEYRSSRQYLERILGRRPVWLWPWLVYRHLYSSGVTLLDRAAVIMGHGYVECSFEGEPEILKALAEEKGVILLSAHLGSWEMGGQLIARHGRPVNLVVLEREQEQIRRLFERALQGRKFQILTTSDDPLRSVPIAAALRRGEMVALHGDRTFGTDATVRIPFLGAPATFPVGPYLLAAATGAPLIHVFAVREKLRSYRFLSFPAQHVPRERGPAQAAILNRCATQYVEHLTSVLKEYPFQWYNFYPFWDENTD